ncbi:MAG: hypothetical protein VYD00_03830 [Pseudomonadota bacterium]|nr:hypothetical protein [Pseudomonadota bacterium]
MMRRLIILAGAAILAGCGQQAALEPPPGESLPPAPYGSAERPDA